MFIFVQLDYYQNKMANFKRILGAILIIFAITIYISELILILYYTFGYQSSRHCQITSCEIIRDNCKKACYSTRINGTIPIGLKQESFSVYEIKRKSYKDAKDSCNNDFQVGNCFCMYQTDDIDNTVMFYNSPRRDYISYANLGLFCFASFILIIGITLFKKCVIIKNGENIPLIES